MDRKNTRTKKKEIIKEKEEKEENRKRKKHVKIPRKNEEYDRKRKPKKIWRLEKIEQSSKVKIRMTTKKKWKIMVQQWGSMKKKMMMRKSSVCSSQKMNP